MQELWIVHSSLLIGDRVWGVANQKLALSEAEWVKMQNVKPQSKN